jgi:hypothetical protein
MIAPLTSLLVLKIHPLKIIRVLILVPPLPMLQAVLEPTLKEQLPRSKQLSVPLKCSILPLPLIPVVFIECKHSIPAPLPFIKGSLKVIPVFIVGLPFPMRLVTLPIPDVFNNLIIAFGLGNQSAFPIERSIFKFPLIPRPIGEGIDPMSALLIILPIPHVGVIISVSILPVAMLILPPH